MKTSYFLILASLVFCVSNSQAQVASAASPWKTYDQNGYYIEYPSEWEVNGVEDNGMQFAFLSPLSSETDNFSENINLLKQDISSYNLDLDSYVDISKKQIASMVEDGKILVSQKLEKNGRSFYEMVYAGEQEGMTLKWKQYCWVENGNAYVLTYTAMAEEYDNYESTATQIMDSFKLKK